jgi:hypothetical protein
MDGIERAGVMCGDGERAVESFERMISLRERQTDGDTERGGSSIPRRREGKGNRSRSRASRRRAPILANGSAVRQLQRRGASQISPKATKTNISTRNAVLRAATARKASTGDKCMVRLADLRSPMGNSPTLSLFRFPIRNSRPGKPISPDATRITPAAADVLTMALMFVFGGNLGPRWNVGKQCNNSGGNSYENSVTGWCVGGCWFRYRDADLHCTRVSSSCR